jgi:hypothetical protein
MYAEHDANEVRLGLMSGGQIANRHPGPGGFWPKDTENKYVFGSGIWIAGIADVDGDGIEDTLGLQMYNPLSGWSECAPGRIADDPDDPLSRLFLSTNPQDLNEWPDEFRDKYGNPVVHSLQDIVGFYNDVSGQPHFAGGPYGIQVAQRSMAFLAGRTSQVIIFEWEMRNLSGSVPGGPYAIENAYIGIDSDMDIGVSFNDDRTSRFIYQDNLATPEPGDSIPINMAFAWDDDFEESDFVGIPGFVGVKFLRSPGNDGDGIDNDRDGLVDESPHNGTDDDGWVDEEDEVDEMGLVNYTWHISRLGGLRDPESDEAVYRMMACDPPRECGDTIESSEFRFLMSSGPFEWRPGMTVKVAAAYVFALPVGLPDHIDTYGDPPRPDPNDPVFADFLAVALETQGFFDAGYPDSLVGTMVYDTDEFPDTNDLAGPYAVFTSVVSSEGIAAVRLYSSRDGGAHYSETEMTHVAVNTYRGEIEGMGRKNGEVLYFVEAVDSSFQVVRDPREAPTTTFGFNVFYTPSFFPPDSVAGLAWTSESRSFWFDYDRDGDLDLALENPGYEPNRLFRNEGGRLFTDVTEESGIGLSESYTIESVHGDYDNDGYPDLAVGTLHSGALLLRNDGEGRFVDVTVEMGIGDSLRVRWLSWTDADSDGYLDLLIASSTGILLYMNENGDQMSEEAGSRGLSSPELALARDLLCFDADGDHDEDILFYHTKSLYFENEGGHYLDRTEDSGLGLNVSDAFPFDIDSDSDLDLFLNTYPRLHLLANNGSGRFSDVSARYGIDEWPDHSGPAPSAADVNADGLPDVLVPHGGYYVMDESMFFIAASKFFGGADTTSKSLTFADADGNGMLDVFKDGLWLSAGFPGGLTNNWLEVDLEGTLSNRSAIGATATLRSGGVVSTGVVSGSANSPHRLHFGFGTELPDSLTVRWPSGIVQVVRDLPVNALVTVVEDSTLSGVGGGETSGALPKAFALHQNYPNPFNPQTTIAFDIPEGKGKVAVRLSVYDLRGRLVRRLIEGELSPGRHTLVWDGRNDDGTAAGSGAYLYTLKAGDFTSRRKLTLLR